MQYIHRLLKWIIITGALINILITLFIQNITVSESRIYSITWHIPEYLVGTSIVTVLNRIIFSFLFLRLLQIYKY